MSRLRIATTLAALALLLPSGLVLAQAPTPATPAPQAVPPAAATPSTPTSTPTPTPTLAPTPEVADVPPAPTDAGSALLPPPADEPASPPAAAAPPAPAAPNSDEAPADEEESFELQPPKLFGYIQVHYRQAIAAGADQNVDYGDFRVQRARLGVKGDIFSWLGYDVEVDPRSPEITGVLRDAFIALKVIPRHEIRIGQQKTQFGYENPESSTKLYAVNRTEVSDNLSRGGVTLRDIGIGLLGNVKLGGGYRIEDAITVVNGEGMNVQADATKMKDVWGRLGARYKDDGPGNFLARLGVSGGVGDFIDEGDDPIDHADDFRLEFRRFGVDAEIDQDWFFISSEYAVGTDKDTSTGEKSNPHGYYVNVVGKTPWQVGPIVRYDTMDDDFKRWTFGLFYGLPEEPFRVMLNYEYRQLRDGVRADDKFYVWVQAKFE